ncbi:MAG: DUF362 domain-containing protein [Myxococcales bacterium]|nr:DUF362 domain-containing protein [Myxococcales bacterium]MCB9651976.1 DUF362 domain-containing protein [Deltaproteobacteria bacterium]
MSEHDAHRRAERRHFLKQAGLTAGAALGAGVGTSLLWDPTGERGKPQAELLRLPEGGYQVEKPSTAADLGVARGDRVDALLKGAVDAIGGIQRYVQPGDVVLIKPNVAFERVAQLGATSNPELITALVHLVRDAGAREVRVADNPIESPENCFVRSGVGAAAHQAGATVYLPRPGDFEILNVPGAKWIERWPFFWSPFRGVTKVIGVAPVKDHNLCRASMTTKNWYGLLGGRRNQFHQDIHGIIADLALMMRPTFVVLDGTRVLFRSGPTGGSLSDVKPAHTVVASRDMLAADAFGWAELLERKDEPLPAYFGNAAGKGLGNPDYKSLVIKETRVG